MFQPIDSEWRLPSLSLIVSLFKWDRPTRRILKGPSRKRAQRHNKQIFVWSLSIGEYWAECTYELYIDKCTGKFIKLLRIWGLLLIDFECNRYINLLFQYWWWFCRTKARHSWLWMLTKALSHCLNESTRMIIGSSCVCWLIIPKSHLTPWRSRPLETEMNCTCELNKKPISYSRWRLVVQM